MTKAFRDRYPPPWRIEESDGGFTILAANGDTILAMVCCPGTGARIAMPGRYLTRAEARAMANAIAKLGRGADAK